MGRWEEEKDFEEVKGFKEIKEARGTLW